VHVLHSSLVVVVVTALI